MEKADYSYDPITKVLSTNENQYDTFPNGFGCFLFERLKANAEKIAQIDAITGEEDLFSSYLQRSIRIAIELKRRSVKPDDVICICSSSNLNCTVPVIASQFIGCKVSSLDPYITTNQAEYFVNLLKPKFIFVSQNAEDLIEDAVRKCQSNSIIVVFGETGQHIKFEDWLDYKDEEDSFQPYETTNVEETAIIAFSSGTTGLPKGICLNHTFLMSQTNRNSSQTTLTYASLYWTSSLTTFIHTIDSGTCRVVYPKFDPKLVWDHIEKFKVNVLLIVPYAAIDMLYEKPKEHISQLTYLFIGGTPISNEYLQKLKDEMPKTQVYLLYGLTETKMITNPFHQFKCKDSTVGIPLRGYNFKIVDPETSENLGIYKTGEVLIKSKHCITEYYQIDNFQMWDEDGFLKTGDIGYFDENFCLYILGRFEDFIKYKSTYIIPSKIEALLQLHPAVKIALVVGVPHEEDENHLVGVVVPQKDSNVDCEEIKAFVDERVDDLNKLRGGVMFVETLPITPNGKVMRKELLDIVLRRRNSSDKKNVTFN